VQATTVTGSAFFSVLLLSMAGFSEPTAADVVNGKGESNSGVLTVPPDTVVRQPSNASGRRPDSEVDDHIPPKVLRTRSGFQISKRNRVERASRVYAVVVSFAPESRHFKSLRSDRRSRP